MPDPTPTERRSPMEHERGAGTDAPIYPELAAAANVVRTLTTLVAMRGTAQKDAARHAWHTLRALFAALEAERARAASFRAVLEGAEYNQIDVVTSPEHGLALGQAVAGRTKAYVARAKAAEAALAKARDDALGTEAARDVLAERRRQIETEGWTPDHDDAHVKREIARAAACYAHAAGASDFTRGLMVSGVAPAMWPWGVEWWRPHADRRRDLVKAGALILAEIERLDRAALREGGGR